MLQRIFSRYYVFTVSGDLGALTAYDSAGQVVATGLRTVTEAEAACDALTARLPERQPRARPEAPVTGRSRDTGY